MKNVGILLLQNGVFSVEKYIPMYLSNLYETVWIELDGANLVRFK